MAINLDPDLWFDAEGAAANLVSAAAGSDGTITLRGEDTGEGIPGLALSGSGDGDDSTNAARILKAILERVYTYQNSLETADKPTTMVVSRSATSSGDSLTLTYSVRFAANPTTAEVASEA